MDENIQHLKDDAINVLVLFWKEFFVADAIWKYQNFITYIKLNAKCFLWNSLFRKT